jgi:hypothetical protein
MKENYITISTLKKMSIENNEDEQRMTSLEIAELTGKQHKHVMEAIRKMEAGWAQVAGSNFRLGSYKDANGQLRPCYNLSKTETLYIATKFNDGGPRPPARADEMTQDANTFLFIWHFQDYSLTLTFGRRWAAS